MRGLQKSLQNDQNFSDIALIPANVPLLQFKHVKSGLKVDISFNRPDGVVAVKMIKEYLIRYPELKYLTFMIKYIMKASGNNDVPSGGIASFSLTLLVISYLQNSKKQSPDRKLYLSEHLINILKLYGNNFNYKDVGISIRFGGAYFKRHDNDDEVGKLVTHRGPLLHLENPQRTEINLGKPITKINGIIKSFFNAYKNLVYNP
jgi:non-canonical poly(A) RNA polymerase PAPD5/7